MSIEITIKGKQGSGKSSLIKLIRDTINNGQSELSAFLRQQDIVIKEKQTQ